MDERCTYCSQALNEYPVIMSDEARRSVYHVACAVELATDIMVDLYTFFSPPAPYDRLFVITAPGSKENSQPSGVAGPRLKQAGKVEVEHKHDN